jgi:hypothetical protein
MIPEALDAAPQTQDRDNAFQVTMKVLKAAGRLTPDLPLASPSFGLRPKQNQ